MIVWIDYETTGLDPRKGSLLEIAMIATDDDFNQIGEPFMSIIRPLHMRGWEVMDDYVKGMHTNSGLIEQIYNIGALFHGEDPSSCLLPDLPRLGDVERAAINWVHDVAHFYRSDVGGGIDREGIEAEVAKRWLKCVLLGGNTVHFDKRWAIEHMDEFEALFSHRIYDVSTLTLEMKQAAPEVYNNRPGLGPDGKPLPQHRALPDIRSSIATAKFYRKHITWSLLEKTESA